MKATKIVHWPGKDTPACDSHAQKATNLAMFMGFFVSSTECSEDIECANCVNEAAKNAISK